MCVCVCVCVLLFVRVRMCVSVYVFSNLKQKIHHIIISRVISCHMGPMYIETLCLYIFVRVRM